MLRRTFRAFRHRNYRWFFTGQLASMMGGFMQQVALAWIVYELTGSAFLLSALITASLLPALFIGPIAGVAADRWERRKILRYANAAFAAQAALVLACFLNGWISVPILIGLSLILGIAQGFDWPVRQSLIMDLVDDRDDIGNVIALNSTLWNLSRLLGPLIGGALVGSGAIAACFVLNAAGSLWAWYSIGQLRTRHHRQPQPGSTIRSELIAGIRYCAGHPVVRSCMLISIIGGMLLLPYTALLPIVASEWLNGGPKLYGLLSAVPAVGAVLGGLYLAAHRNPAGLPRMIYNAGIVCSLALIAFSISRNIPLTIAILTVLGFAFLLQMSACNTLLQLSIDESMRGRVMALYTSLFTGTFPLSLLITGALADVFGADRVLMIAGGIALVCFLFLRRSPIVETPPEPCLNSATVCEKSS